MPEKIRRSWLAKLIAAGFIYIVILGNIWFSRGISGDSTPHWMMVAFVIGMIWVLGLGVAMGVQWIYLWHTDQLHSGDQYGLES